MRPGPKSSVEDRKKSLDTTLSEIVALQQNIKALQLASLHSPSPSTSSTTTTIVTPSLATPSRSRLFSPSSSSSARPSRTTSTTPSVTTPVRKTTTTTSSSSSSTRPSTAPKPSSRPSSSASSSAKPKPSTSVNHDPAPQPESSAAPTTEEKTQTSSSSPTPIPTPTSTPTPPPTMTFPELPEMQGGESERKTLEDFLVASSSSSSSSTPRTGPGTGGATSPFSLLSPSLSDGSFQENSGSLLDLKTGDFSIGPRHTSGTGSEGKGKGQDDDELDDPLDLTEMSAIEGEGVSFIHDLLRLEGELKSKNHQLEGLLRQTSQLSRLVKTKEATIKEVTEALETTRGQIAELEKYIGEKHEEITKERMEKEELSKQNQNLLKEVQDLSIQASHVIPGITPIKRNKDTLRLESRYQTARGSAGRTSLPPSSSSSSSSGAGGLKSPSTRPTASSTKSQFQEEQLGSTPKRSTGPSRSELMARLPQELYFHVMNLDNQLIEKEKIVLQLKAEVTDLKRQNRELEQFLHSANRDLDKSRAQIETDSSRNRDLQMTINRIGASERKLNIRCKELLNENKALELRLQKMSNEIHTLTQSTNGNSRVQQALHLRDEEISRLRDRVSSLESSLSSRDFSSVVSTPDSIPFHLWKEERAVLQGQIKKLRGEKDRNEKTIEAQRERIVQLCNRIDIIGASLSDTFIDNKNVMTVNSLLRSIKADGSIPSPSFSLPSSSSSSSSTSSSLLSPSSSSSKDPSSSSSTSLSPSVVLRSYESIFQAGERGKGEDVFLDPQSGVDSSAINPDPDSFISVHLYHVLENELLKMKSLLHRKDELLRQKDKDIEILQHRLQIATRKRLATPVIEEEEEREEGEGEEEPTSREKRYRLEIHKLKAILRDQSLQLSRVPSLLLSLPNGSPSPSPLNHQDEDQDNEGDHQDDHQEGNDDDDGDEEKGIPPSFPEQDGHI